MKKTLIPSALVAAVLGAFFLTPASAATKGTLAEYHQGKHVTCETCHTTSTVSDSETEINAKCVQCHGTMAEMGERSGGHAREPNPHLSHLGNINCTACHSGHQESTVYCLNCHAFPELKIPFSTDPKPKKPSLLTDNLAVAPKKTEMTDLIIIGSGAAGSVAALEAREAGVKNIVMLEKMAIPGGNSQLAAGGMNAAGTVFQKALGIKDTPETMFNDTMKGGKYANNPDLAHILADNSAGSINWLLQHGAKLDSVGRGGGASEARMHGPSGGNFVGPYLQNFFKKVLKEANIDLRLNSRVVKIEMDKDGKVTGVWVQGKHSGLYRLNAKAVVLATGGIGANKVLLKMLRPDIPETTLTSNQPGTQGDGLILAEKVGAATVDVKEVQLNPTLLVGSPVIISERVRGAGAIFVNLEGKRFISELLTRDVTSKAIGEQTKGVAFEVFDQKVRDRLSLLKAAFTLGLVKEGNTVAELAKNMGVDPATLEKTVKTYNEYVDQGKDLEFQRADLPLKLDSPKYYAILITPAIHHHMGGVKINTHGQVINTDGKVIEGLFAAGEVTGGVHGKNRLGGNAVSDTITFGRIAGDSAAKRVLGKE